jgi:hypothetical protein
MLSVARQGGPQAARKESDGRTSPSPTTVKKPAHTNASSAGSPTQSPYAKVRCAAPCRAISVLFAAHGTMQGRCSDRQSMEPQAIAINSVPPSSCLGLVPVEGERGGRARVDETHDAVEDRRRSCSQHDGGHTIGGIELLGLVVKRLRADRVGA